MHRKVHVRFGPGATGKGPHDRDLASGLPVLGLIHTSGPKLTRLAGKYGPLVPVLRELVLRPDTPLNRDVKDKIVRQLDKAGERLAAVRGD